jgi:hypothetical protein
MLRSIFTKAVERRSCSPKWIRAVGAKTAYIEPGSPWENAYTQGHETFMSHLGLPSNFVLQVAGAVVGG